MHYILVFLSFLTLLYAKPTDFSIIIDKPFNNALLDITQDYDRQISAVGFSRDYKTSSNRQNSYSNAFNYLDSLSSHGLQMHLIRVDNNSAEITLNKASKLSKFSEAVALVKTPSNGYFVGGYTLDGSLIVLKLNSNGNLIFNKKFGTKNYDRMNNLILMSDGGVLAIGSSITSRSQNDPLFSTGLGLNDIYLTRFSKEGRILWSKKYGTIYDDRGIDAVEAYDGSIIVVSTTRYKKNKNITLMRITENGNKIWLHHYKQDKTTTPHKIIRLRDNNFVVALSQIDTMRKEQIRLIKFDLQKNIIIDREIHTTYNSVIKDIKEYSNSNLIAVGYIEDSYNTDALVMLLDNELVLLHQEHYGEDNYDKFNAVTILSNSQAAAAGIFTNENSQESNMWIVKLNRDSTIAQVSTKTTDFYDELKKIFKEEIRNNQIKIREDLSIELNHKNLHFNAGQYKLTPEQKKFLDKFGKKIIPFLKANMASIDTIEINGHTSSEWGGANFTNSYLKNEKLSMNRSYSTLAYLFKKQTKPTQVWLSKVIKGSGLGYSKKIVFDNIEYKQRSRRVSFKIILNKK